MQEAKVYKKLESDFRFKNDLQRYLYFRLWGYEDTYKPFKGSVNMMKSCFKLPYHNDIMKKNLNDMIKSKLIFTYKTKETDREGDPIYITGANNIGDRDGEYYYMTPSDIEVRKNNFVVKSPDGSLKADCKQCPMYNKCYSLNQCVTVLLKKLHEYEMGSVM